MGPEPTEAEACHRFVLARFAEDEAVAAAEAVLRDGDPYFENEASAFERRFDPARVLAECAAKRAIVENIYLDPEAFNTEYRIGWNAGVEATAKILAAVYAEHPDYDEAWVK